MHNPRSVRAMNNILFSGYEHYSRKEEREAIDHLLKGDLSGLESLDPGQFVLASQPLRSTKNNLICLAAVTCRYAADIGADDKRCYVLSDYYINEIEKIDDAGQFAALVKEMLADYRDLVQEGQEKAYSLPVLRAIRYINNHLYETCRVEQIAAVVKLHPTYLSYLFKQEVGTNLTNYVREKKMAEARNLLLNSDRSISEIAESLGYSSLSYFSRVFRTTYTESPRKFSVSGTSSS